MKYKGLLTLMLVITITSCSSLLVRIGNIGNKLSENPKRNKKNFHPLPFSAKYEIDDNVTSFEDIAVQLINSAQLCSMLAKNDSSYKYICIFTSGCKGTSGELNYIKRSRSGRGQQVQFILISSDNLAPYLVQMIQKKLYSHQYYYPVYIIDQQIKSFLDDRKRGEIFRNQICPDCKNDIIGVPYVLLFDKQNRVLFHGYRGYKTELPADIIKYFVGY
jgi:disulfide oxidoreductase YuzD